jgi:hypothetical protein
MALRVGGDIGNDGEAKKSSRSVSCRARSFFNRGSCAPQSSLRQSRQGPDDAYARPLGKGHREVTASSEVGGDTDSESQ